LIDRSVANLWLLRVFAFCANEKATACWLVGSRLAIAVIGRQIAENEHVFFYCLQGLQDSWQLA
jgi:hypothetical protein